MGRVWYAKDAAFLDDPAIVELGERHGPAGPLVIDALLGLAKLAREKGRVTVGPTALARRAFVDGADTVRAILRDSAEFGLLEVDDVSTVKCEVRFPQWDRWQSSFRQAQKRDRDSSVTERDSSVTERDSSVTNRDAPVRATITGTGTKEQQESETSSDSVEPKLDAAARNGSEAGVVRELFEMWQERCNHPQAKLTKDRRQKMKARLGEGYTPEQIRVAIEGAARAPYVSNDGKKFDDLELICRNGSKLESFIERGRTPDDPIAALVA